MTYIFNIILIINILFFLVEILHSFNNIDLVLIFVSVISFYILFFVLSSVVNEMYSNFVYRFFFKFLYFFLLLKKNIKKLLNINLLQLIDIYILLFVKKYSIYMYNLNTFFYLVLNKKKSLNSILNFSIDFLNFKLLNKKKYKNLKKNRYFLHI